LFKITEEVSNLSNKISPRTDFIAQQVQANQTLSCGQTPQRPANIS